MGVAGKIKRVSFDEAKNTLSTLKYALVYEMSNVWFEHIDMLADINWDEFLEGYFFDENMQVHIYRENDNIYGIVFEEDDNMEYVDKEYELANKYKAIGKNVLRREYFDYDEDGQVYVAYTRLVNVH